MHAFRALSSPGWSRVATRDFYPLTTTVQCGHQLRILPSRCTTAGTFTPLHGGVFIGRRPAGELLPIFLLLYRLDKRKSKRLPFANRVTHTSTPSCVSSLLSFAGRRAAGCRVSNISSLKKMAKDSGWSCTASPCLPIIVAVGEYVMGVCARGSQVLQAAAAHFPPTAVKHLQVAGLSRLPRPHCACRTSDDWSTSLCV